MQIKIEGLDPSALYSGEQVAEMIGAIQAMLEKPLLERKKCCGCEAPHFDITFLVDSITKELRQRGVALQFL